MNIYVDISGAIKTAMVDCVAAEDVRVLAGIDKGLQSIGIDICDQKSKFVSCNFDGVSVNMGKHNVIAKKLQRWVGDNLI